MGLHRATILASEAATAATRTSEEQITPPLARGLILRVKTGTLTTSPTFTPSIQRKALDGTWDTYWTAAAAISTATTATYILYPGAADGNATEVDGIPIPQIWRLVLTFGGTGSALTTDADYDYCH